LAINKEFPTVVSIIKSEQQRKKFYTLTDFHIEYNPYRSIIYSRCYPTDNVSFPDPAIGWNEAYKLRKKLYFDEIFFYLHMYVASSVDSREFSNNKGRFRSSSNRTYELMDVLTSELKEYIALDVTGLVE